jgi:signal transduction histidine kinase
MELSPSFYNPVYLAYLVAFGLAAVSCLASLRWARQLEDSDTRRGLEALLLTSGGWSAAHVAFLLVPSVRLKTVFYVVGLILGFAAIGAWLYFCSAYTGRSLHRLRLYRRLAVAVFATVVAVKLTNPIHNWYFTTTVVTSPFPHLAVNTGPLHWTLIGLSYALSFVGYFMLLELFTEVDYDTTPLLVLVGLTGVPVVFNIVGFVSPALVDITYEPLGVAAFAAGIGFVYFERFQEIQLAGEREEPIIIFDSENHIRDHNQPARDLFPTLQGVYNRPLDDVLPSVATWRREETPVFELSTTETTRYYHLRETAFGTTRSGRGGSLVFTDITDREQYRKALERQNERLAEFADMVSHDLRNPLNVAQGRVDLALEAHDDNQNLTAAADALGRMEAIIDDVLTLARQGQSIDSFDPVSLPSFIERCWRMVETDDARVAVDCDATVEAAPERLQRLFENLFRNSVEHGGRDVTVTVGRLTDSSGFYVEDDGSGIPEDRQESIFESGYTTNRSGTGFGLSIVAEIVDAHGWDIAVTDAEGGGARFEITGVNVV